MTNRDHIVCTCIGTTLGEIQDLIAENPDITVEGIMDKTGAGTVCAQCIDGSNGEEINLQSLVENKGEM